MANNNTDKSRAVPRPHDWTDVLAPEIIKQFVGKHIAIVYKRVIASGTSYDGVLEECIRLFPEETPYMAYIPTPEEALDEDSATTASHLSGPSAYVERPRPLQVRPTTPAREVYDLSPDEHAPPASATVASNFAPARESNYNDESFYDDSESFDSSYGEEVTPAVYEPSTIHSISPSSGPVGTLVTITGEDFIGVSEVLFNGIPATAFNLTSETSLSVVVPDEATSGVVSVTTPNGVEYGRPGFAVIPPPSVTTFEPAAGGIGTSITIVGTSLAGASRVTFTGATQPTIATRPTPNSITDKSLRTVVPFGAVSGPLTVTTPGGTATSESSFTVVRPPKVTGLSDLSGGVGSAVTITGTDLDGATAVKFGGVPVTAFTVNSPTSISVTVPGGARSGLVSVTTPGGLTAGQLPFTVIPPPNIFSFSPKAGVVGTVVTITGTHLSGVDKVSFGPVSALVIKVLSDDTVAVTVPEDAESGAISLTSVGGTSNSSEGFRVIPNPFITSFSPAATGAGGIVTIAGSGLLDASSVSFDDVEAAQYSVDSDSEIRAIVPRNAPSGVIAVVTPGGRATSDIDFNFIPEPHVYSVKPAAGGIGATVSIEGNNLSGATSVSFGGVLATDFIASSDTLISAVVPTGVENGPVSVLVVTPGGESASGTAFTVVYPPEIFEFSPVTAPVGSRVSISGANFTEASVVAFNDVPAVDLESISPSSIEAVVPPGAVNGRISVTTVGGSVMSPNEFIVVQPPVVESVEPLVGWVGQKISIAGINFDDISSVTFNGIPVPFILESPTSLVAEIPEGASSGPIKVNTPGGAGSFAQPFTFIPAPTVADFEPVSAPTGAQITVSGANFSNATAVTLNGNNVFQFDVVSDSVIKVQLGDENEGGKIGVVTPAGSGISGSELIIIPTPTIGLISPETAGAGQSISIYGTNFFGASSVVFNGIEAPSFTVESESLILAAVPSGDVSGEIKVITSGGAAVSEVAFHLVPLPIVDSVTPSSDGIGKEVKISGRNLYDVISVFFGSIKADEFVELSDTSLMVRVPADAENGQVSIVTPGGKSIDDVRFAVAQSPVITYISPTVAKAGSIVEIGGENFTEGTIVKFNDTVAEETFISSSSFIETRIPEGARSGYITLQSVGGSVTSTEPFTVLQPPKIDSFSPLSNGAGGLVTIFGEDFTDVQEVRFNDLKARHRVDSPTELVAEVPAKASSGPITIITNGGSGQSAVDFSFVLPPYISSFEPATAAIGASVTLTGVYFSGASKVTLADKDVASFEVLSDFSIAVVLGGESSDGFFSVVTSGGTAVSDFDFKLIPPPVITSFSPAAAGAGKGISLYGSGLLGTSRVIFNGVDSTEITIESDALVDAVVPKGASSGEITVVAPGGTVIATNSFNFIQYPTVKSLSPRYGGIGTDVTVQGDNLSSTISVSFGGIETSEIVVLSDSSIVAKVPSGADSGDVIVTTMGGQASGTAEFFVVHPPAISDVSPYTGVVGTVVNVSGSNFNDEITVKFGEHDASEVQVTSAGTLQAVVPSGAVSARITITTAGGTAASPAEFIVVDPPQVESFMPSAAGLGSTITIYGSNFIDVTLVKFNEFSSTFSVKSPGQLVAEVPADASTGPITIVTPAGTAVGSEDFVVLQTPSISSFEPVAAPAGAVITLTGQYFTGATKLKLGGRDVADFKVVSDTTISATLGAYASSGLFSLSTPGGTATSEQSLHIISAPIVKRFIPASGGVGSSLTVLGANLIGVSAVTVGGVQAIEFAELSDTELSVVIPNGVSSGVVSVTTPAGTASSSAKFGVLPVPVIKSFTPSTDGIGAKVMITGAALSGANLIKFNDTVATKYTVISATFVSVEVPHGATTGPISITTAGGTVVSQSSFVVVPQPVINSLSLDEGPVGAKVTVFGENFSGTTRVALNGISQANFVIESDDSLTFEVGENAESGLLTVTNTGGIAEAPSNFTVIPYPKIVSFTPLSGPVGTVITVTGVSLDRATSASVNDEKANVASLSSTRVKVFVPNNATTGLVSIVTRFGTCVSNQEFEVAASASIQDIKPSSAAAGSNVAITGRGFAGATAVLFSGAYSPSVVVNSNTSITAQVPYGAQSGEVHVQLPSGSTLSHKQFQVTLSINSIEPSYGSPGTVVTISGVGLSDVRAVDFGGVEAEFRAVSDTTLIAHAPIDGVDGVITVQTSEGATSSAVGYFYPPTIISVTPESGPRTALVQIAMSKNIDLTNEDCEVEFSDNVRVQPSYIDPLDHVVYVLVPPDAVSGPIRLSTRGGTAESLRDFDVTEE